MGKTMNALKTLMYGLITPLLCTSAALACAAHGGKFDENPPTAPRIEEAVIYMSDVEVDSDGASGTLRVFLNLNELEDHITELSVRLKNAAALDEEIDLILAKPNSGELVIEFDAVQDFYVGTWEVRIMAIDVYGTYSQSLSRV